MKNIISLSVLGVAVLGFIIYFIISKMVQDDTVSKSFQLPQKVASSKPAFVLQEQVSSVYPELKDYEVIGENNIFRPLGWQREGESLEELVPTTVSEPIVRVPSPPPTYTLVLTGIAKSGSDWIAVVEDWEREEGVFLRRGELLKDVRVQDILSEHIILVRDEVTLQLALGESIEYGIDGRLRFNTASTAKISRLSNEAGAPSGIQADSGDSGQSLIERMRARRRKELSQ